MALLNCARCGKLFAQDRLAQEVCLTCFALQEQEFQLCGDYLSKHPTTTIQELSENTGIPLSRMMNWITEGRIHFS